MSEFDRSLNNAELQEWRLIIEAANQHNVFCHCRQCDREWVASVQAPCACGSSDVEYILCWQFPDD